jgi:hypothetical protein
MSIPIPHDAESQYVAVPETAAYWGVPSEAAKSVPW